MVTLKSEQNVKCMRNCLCLQLTCISCNGMSDNIVYVIQGPPAPWARVAPDYSNRRLYDTQKNLKLLVGIELSKQHDMRPLYEGPISLDFCFYFKVPINMNKKKASMLGTPYSHKPDISNLIKFYEDVSNKILFRDDCLIAAITAKKVYDECPRTEFTIKRL